MGTEDKNGGPNYLRAWRIKRGLTQEQLAQAVGTNANMIQYLESGERGLSAKWLRRLSEPLKTTPGMLLETDPDSVDIEIHDIWAMKMDRDQRRQLKAIAEALVRTGTDNSP
jgi:transcriptional regulator with XRE-family HTH domain